MRVLGIVPSTTAVYLCWVTCDAGPPFVLNSNRVRLPNNDDQSLRLMAFMNLMSTLFIEQPSDRIVLLQAGNSKFGGPSPLRAKVECTVQLASVMRGIPLTLLAPQTLRAFEKRNDLRELARFEVCDSKDARDAALLAWREVKNVTL